MDGSGTVSTSLVRKGALCAGLTVQAVLRDPASGSCFVTNALTF